MNRVGIERSEPPTLLVPLIGIPARNPCPDLPKEVRCVVRIDAEAAEVEERVKIFEQDREAREAKLQAELDAKEAAGENAPENAPLPEPK